MNSPAAPLRGGAVGASTIALAVAAHGAADGGYPSGAAVVFLLLVGAAIGGGVVMPSARSGLGRLTTTATGLMLGQLAAHVALTLGDAHSMVHAHAIVPSPTMLAAHAVAAIAVGGLVYAAERLYGPITSVVSAILSPPLPLPDASARPLRALAAGFAVLSRTATSISTRGPPVSQF